MGEGSKDSTKNENSLRVEGLAVTPVPVDYDGDGDLDLIVGNIVGHVMTIYNEGDRYKPVFGKAELISAGGSPIKLDGDAGPTVADWDHDGIWDLVVGSNNGAIMFYRNQGSAAHPEFAAGVTLVGPVDEEGRHEPLVGTPERSQYRPKVNCVDWNGDGLLDLLVGDYASAKIARKFTQEQLDRKEALRVAAQAISDKLQPYYQKADSLRTENEKKQLKELEEQANKIYAELNDLEEQQFATGWVWVYVRKAGSEVTKAGK